MNKWKRYAQSLEKEEERLQEQLLAAQERAQEAEQAARFEKVAAKDAEHLASQALTLRARAEAAEQQVSELKEALGQIEDQAQRSNRDRGVYERPDIRKMAQVALDKVARAALSDEADG